MTAVEHNSTMDSAASRDRTTELAAAFVELTQVLANRNDVVEMLVRVVEQCVRLLGVDEAGLVLADSTGTLRVVASTSEQARFLELFQLQVAAGPCVDCYRTGEPVGVADLGTHARRWPQFVEYARGEGYHSVHTTPLKVPDQTIGALNLFSTARFQPGPADLMIVRALGDAAAVAVLYQRALQNSERVADQLQNALTSRVIIEQAKGKLAEQGGIDTGTAFVALRGHARNTHQTLSDTAHAVVAGTLTLRQIVRSAK